jgi:hypothetical protein
MIDLCSAYTFLNTSLNLDVFRDLLTSACVTQHRLLRYVIYMTTSDVKAEILQGECDLLGLGILLLREG